MLLFYKSRIILIISPCLLLLSIEFVSHENSNSRNCYDNTLIYIRSNKRWVEYWSNRRSCSLIERRRSFVFYYWSILFPFPHFTLSFRYFQMERILHQDFRSSFHYFNRQITSILFNNKHGASKFSHQFGLLGNSCLTILF